MAQAVPRNEHRRVNKARWSGEHDVIHELVPFDHYKTDPWEQLHGLQSWLESQPEHVSTWRWDTAPDFDNLAHYSPREQLFRDLLGAWPYRTDPDGRSVFVNPYYDQLDQVEWVPDEHKMLHWLRMAFVGKWTTRDAAARFDHHHNAVHDMFKVRGMTWGGMQEIGRARLANTVKLAKAWTGRSVTDCARAIDVPPRTLRQWVTRKATLVEIPDRPSNQGFASNW